MVQPHCGSLSSVLTPPARKEVAPRIKSCGRVLTSVENLKAIEEKERLKKEKEKQKEERKQRIEQKKKEKAEQAEKRRKNIEAKKLERLNEAKCTRGPGQRKTVRSERDGKYVSESDKTQRMTFTEDEIKLFERRFENGYDLKNDERYNTWLKTRTSEGKRFCEKGR